MPKVRTCLATVVTLVLATGCITKKEHERLMADAQQRFDAAQAAHQQQMAGAQAQIKSLEEELAGLKQEIADRDAQLAELNATVANLKKKLDDSVALNEQLRQTLERAGKSVDKLLSEKGDLADALEANKKRLEELRKAQAAAKKRAALYEELLGKFKKMIDAGELSIVVRDGRLVLQLRNDVLFDSGQVALKKDGEQALDDVASILASMGDREWQVAGHTDNVPISTGRFPSNWELSAARAVQVVKFLVDHGVKGERISAAGYGEFDPVAPNDTTEGKAKNRRIEITLQPDLSELVQLPTPKPSN